MICKKTVTVPRAPTRKTSQLINTAQHKITPRSHYHLKAAITLNRLHPVVSGPAVTLKQFLQ